MSQKNQTVLNFYAVNQNVRIFCLQECFVTYDENHRDDVFSMKGFVHLPCEGGFGKTQILVHENVTMQIVKLPIPHNVQQDRLFF